MSLSFAAFKVLTFDVVGTLIDFETGVLGAVRRLSGRDAAALPDDTIFASYLRAGANGMRCARARCSPMSTGT